MNRHIATVIMVLLITCSGSVTAQDVKIERFVHPEYTEVQNTNDENWRVTDDLEDLDFPVAARYESEQRQQHLLFRHKNAQYRVARANVELSEENIVVGACETVPSTLPKDAQSASVKGAGERCE